MSNSCGLPGRGNSISALAVLALGILTLARASGTPALCAASALVGAGFGTVMVAATHVVVRQADVASAGAAGGLQQTAMNVGPVLGVAAATALMGEGGAAALSLTVLAALALAGAALGRMLPGRPGRTIDDHGESAERTCVPAGR